jgi:hypothetical protein
MEESRQVLSSESLRALRTCASKVTLDSQKSQHRKRCVVYNGDHAPVEPRVCVSVWQSSVVYNGDYAPVEPRVCVSVWQSSVVYNGDYAPVEPRVCVCLFGRAA